MRALGFLICIVIFAVGLPSAEGFITSQEHQWQQDLNEAKSRARDFEKYLERNRTSSRVREAAADEIKAEREEMEKRAERARREFVRERENRPSLDAVYEKLEKEHEQQELAKAREREKLREAYIESRDRVQAMMRKEAYIDPAREYDVRSAPSIEEQNANPNKAKLKLEVKKTK